MVDPYNALPQCEREVFGYCYVNEKYFVKYQAMSGINDREKISARQKRPPYMERGLKI